MIRMLTLCLALSSFIGLRAIGLNGASTSTNLQWIWAPEDSARAYFRKTFEIDRPFVHPTDEAFLDITADQAFKVWLNGQFVGQGQDSKRVFRFDVNHLTVPGQNVVAIEAQGGAQARGVLVRLGFIPNGKEKRAVLTDSSWRVTTQAPNANWQELKFNDRRWALARSLGVYGQVEPWKKLKWDSGGDERFSVPPGFVVEQVVPPNPSRKHLSSDIPFSLINLTFDAKGRLLVSQERGPVLVCTDPDANGIYQTIKPYCSMVRGCQGMCWVDDALLLVGDGPKGTGLYRVKPKDGQEFADQVELIHNFRGGMGEHGPHAILHGPDDQLYVVSGNHAWATPKMLSAASPLQRWPNGFMGPDQGQPGSTEDVLLPRMNDARGHAANILAPGGTIWRMDKNGQNLALVSCGYRNHFDAAFTPANELITFDSDMEWDEGLPWYRPIRICHAFFGSDFLWRTGAANTPDYYIDSLAPLAELGRGSPVGIESYQSYAFPPNYQGASFLADWSTGVIYCWHSKGSQPGPGTLEKFCQGTPLNVVDMAVGPDGALYFCTGGRGSEGAVFRIRYTSAHTPAKGQKSPLTTPQPYSAWGRAAIQQWKQAHADSWEKTLKDAVKDNDEPWQQRVLALHLLTTMGPTPDEAWLLELARHEGNPELATQALIMVAHMQKVDRVDDNQAFALAIKEAMQRNHPLFRRKACEACIEANWVPPIDSLWPLLSDADREVRTSARLVLQRIPAKNWISRLKHEANDALALECMVALYKAGQAKAYSKEIVDRLGLIRFSPTDRSHLLNELRVWQLMLLQCDETFIKPAVLSKFNVWLEAFPATDDAISRELAILLTYLDMKGWVEKPIHANLLKALLQKDGQHQMQIYYFYCLRLLHKGWTMPQKSALLQWFQTTKAWRGGYSFGPFLENMLKEWQICLEPDDWIMLLDNAEKYAAVLSIMLNQLHGTTKLNSDKLFACYQRLFTSKEKQQTLKAGLLAALIKNLPDARTQQLLRQLGDMDQSLQEVVAKGLANLPCEENWPYIVRGLASSSPIVAVDCLAALKKIDKRPSLEDPAPFRSVLQAATRIDPKDRWLAVEVLRQWTKKQFSLEDGDWKSELPAWGKWFAQTFPNEPVLANTAGLKAESKWQYQELLAFLEKDPKGMNGDPVRGKAVFTKANCIKCHKYGQEGEGIGPDLTTLKSRFKRDYILESILNPSKVIADQYRGSLIMTKKGKQLSGLVAPQGESLTVLLSDGSKVTLNVSEVESMVASTISAMPERLLDELTLQEIADLFAYLESNPDK